MERGQALEGISPEGSRTLFGGSAVIHRHRSPGASTHHQNQGRRQGPRAQQAGRQERRPVADVERLVVLQPGDRELQGGVVLHAALQLHRGAPLGDLVLGHPVDPRGVCREAPELELLSATPTPERPRGDTHDQLARTAEGGRNRIQLGARVGKARNRRSPMEITPRPFLAGSGTQDVVSGAVAGSWCGEQASLPRAGNDSVRAACRPARGPEGGPTRD